MTGFKEKFKEKANDGKDKVVDNSNDIIDATEQSFGPSSSTITPNPAFISPSVTYAYNNTEENNSDIESNIEVKGVDLPFIEHSESEQKIGSTNMTDSEFVKTTTNTISSLDSSANKKKQQNENQ
ncbi:MAG: hypothetical protein ACTHJ7_10445 [Candidatus Nitrosocosmicus sp.]